MKLSTRDAASYLRKPDPTRTGLLIYGADAMRVSLKRQEFLKSLLGPNAEEEMRLTRLDGSELRKEPALLVDALKAIGFFPGPRAVHVEGATDAIIEAINAALGAWAPDDAQMVVTAGALKPASKLRKAFEAHANAYALGVYDDPPGRDEIERALQDSGLQNVPADALGALVDLAQSLDPGDLRQTIEKTALYKLNDPTPLTVEDVSACAPTSTDAQIDDILLLVADAKSAEIAPVMQKLAAQGATPVGLCIGAMRHFRALHRAACDTSGRPAIFGPHRDRMLAQSRRWGADNLETALTLLVDTDLALRSAGQNAPGFALVERAFVRLAMLGAKAR